MRNLKKILALVLALVMSLSLMATAGASSFPDVDAENPYATAIEVLDELKVFQGYKEDGTFRPTETLNRAQAAVLVYRIATGDVEDKYLDNYTFMQQSKFTDLDGYNWAKGYINYCQNAGIVVGTSSTTFEPGKQVTGYQLLVMLLRTLGYGKAGEFADPNGWELKTAEIAEREGITKNVTSGDFGAPAARQMVAEILFRGLLTETVEYSALIAGGYTKSGETLGKRELGLEEVSGIVMANEYADLEDVETMSDGKTRLDVDGTSYTLNVTTDLTDIGESRTAYVKKASQNSFDLVVNKLFGNDNNVRVESGDAQSNISKLARDEAGLDISNAEHFVNFDYSTIGKSEYRIEYQIAFDNTKVYDGKNSQQWFTSEYGLDPEDVIGIDPSNRLDTVDTSVTDKPVYTRIIPMGNDITPEDITLMKGIFSAADDDIHSEVGVKGYVYAGTAKKQNSVDKEHDLSSEMKWSDFYNEYIISKVNTKITSTGNGEWLKIVDNNNDGIAEYVFKTWYILDELTGYNSRYDYFTAADGYKYDGVEGQGYGSQTHFLYDEPAVSDVIRAAYIDGKWQIEKAEPVTATIKTVNYREETVTTTDDETYNESDIRNDTGYAEVITAMDDTTYEIFFDHFGHIRAYRLPNGSTNYALVTEVYPTDYYNNEYVKDIVLKAEVTVQDNETKEHTMTNPGSAKNGWNSFFIGRGNSPWYWDNAKTQTSNFVGALGGPNWLVPAHDAAARSAAWYDFDDTDPTTLNTHTNVAAYSFNDNDDVTLNSAAQLMYNKAHEQLYYAWDSTTTTAYFLDADKNVTSASTSNYATASKVTAEQWEYIKSKTSTTVKVSDLEKVYAVDYIQLAVQDIAKGARHYSVYDDANGYKALRNDYVDAVHDTEYYLVTPENIKWFTDYDNVPEIKKENIRAIYALAENTSRDQNDADYWVPNVIVIELKDDLDGSWDSISLAYYNTFKTSGEIKHLDTLNNKYEGTEVSVVPGGMGWANQWSDFGFYKLYNTADAAEGEISASSIAKIDEEYNEHGIFAGEIKRINKTSTRGGYIDVYTRYDRTFRAGEVPVEDSVVTVNVTNENLYAVASPGGNGKDIAYGLTMDSLEIGDRVVFVGSKSGSRISATYLVDVDFYDDDGDYISAEWLHSDNYYDADGNNTDHGLWQDIVNEQIVGAQDKANVTAVYAETFPAGTTKPTTAPEVERDNANKNDWTVTLPANAPAGYTWLVEATSDKNHDSVIQGVNNKTWHVTNVTGPVIVEAKLVSAVDDVKLTITPTSVTVNKIYLGGEEQASTTLTAADVAHGTLVEVLFTTTTPGAGATAAFASPYNGITLTPSKTDVANQWKVSFGMPSNGSADVTLNLGQTANVSREFKFVGADTRITLNKTASAGAADTTAELTGLKLLVDGKDIDEAHKFKLNSVKTYVGASTTPAATLTATTDFTFDVETGVFTGTSTSITGVTRIEIDAEIIDNDYEVTLLIEEKGTTPNNKPVAVVDSVSGMLSNVGTIYKVAKGANVTITLAKGEGSETEGRFTVTGADYDATTKTITINNVAGPVNVKIDDETPKTITIGAPAHSGPTTVMVDGKTVKTIAKGETTPANLQIDAFVGQTVTLVCGTPDTGYHTVSNSSTVVTSTTTAINGFDAAVNTGTDIKATDAATDVEAIDNDTKTITLKAGSTSVQVSALLAQLEAATEKDASTTAMSMKKADDSAAVNTDVVADGFKVVVTSESSVEVEYTVTIAVAP